MISEQTTESLVITDSDLPPFGELSNITPYFLKMIGCKFLYDSSTEETDLQYLSTNPEPKLFLLDIYRREFKINCGAKYSSRNLAVHLVGMKEWRFTPCLNQ